MDNTAIHISGLGKKYFIGGGEKQFDRFSDRFVDILMTPFRRVRRLLRGDPGGISGLNETIWALKEITFDVKRGEVIGIIGRNGAGKSTLLKILSRITEPTEGYADILGRVGSLLEVGIGFHPELTGRENIYLNGAILGMGKREIDRKYPEIVEFAEIDQFIDTPVKQYSSGMYVRLAFSVAAHLEPDILLVDEVLAVGDAAFQNKCLGKMNQVSSSGRTILFVSHNMGVIQSLCTRGIVLLRGQKAFDGPVDQAVRTYLEYLNQSTNPAMLDNPERGGSGLIQLTKVRALDESDEPSEHLVAGRSASFEFVYENPNRIKNFQIAFTIFNQLGVAATNFDMHLTNTEIGDLDQRGKFICSLPNLPLPVGKYHIATAVYVNDDLVDLMLNAFVFNVDSSVFFESGKTPDLNFCSCMVAHNWQHLNITDDT